MSIPIGYPVSSFSSSSISLGSYNTLDTLRTIPNLLSHPYDSETIVADICASQSFLSAPALANRDLDQESPFTPESIDDEVALNGIRDVVTTA